MNSVLSRIKIINTPRPAATELCIKLLRIAAPTARVYICKLCTILLLPIKYDLFQLVIGKVIKNSSTFFFCKMGIKTHALKIYK